MEKIALLGKTKEELQALLLAWGEAPFRAKQIFSWLYKGASFDDMTNLPLALRDKLSREASLGGAVIAERLVSAIDGTEKFLFSLEDGELVEGVLMRYHHGLSVCISTQVGCRMGCSFCASTLEGLQRSLTAGEMLGQVVAVNSHVADNGEKVSHIVLMGSGEPLDNYEAVLRFLQLVHDPDGLYIGHRNISLSTCGLVREMDRLAEEKLGITLSVSLHAPNDAIRRDMMPIDKVYDIDAVLGAARRYVQRTGRRVVFEYVLIEGVNDAPAHARELAARLRGWQNHVNLIALNAVKENALSASKRAEMFLRVLEEEHISATIRRTMGADIDSACGQLRRRHTEETGGGDRR